jgi:hypothetical protein
MGTVSVLLKGFDYSLKLTNMAELHVEPKKHTSNLTWVWIVIALLIIGAVVYFLMRNHNAAGVNNGTGNGSTTSSLVMPAYLETEVA